MGVSDLTLQSLAFRGLTLLIIAGVHGGIVAGTAVLLGDKGPKYDGRLTIVPAGHIDFLGAIGLLIFGLGWTKPMAIDARQFRVGRSGIFFVILAGFVSLLVTAALLDALIRPALTTLPHTAGLTTAAFLRAASSLSIWFALFNLIPVPPLTGGLLLDAFGSPRFTAGTVDPCRGTARGGGDGRGPSGARPGPCHADLGRPRPVKKDQRVGTEPPCPIDVAP